MSVSRRQFLVSLGVGTYSALLAARESAAAEFPLKRAKGTPPPFFTPIAPSRKDELVVPEGYRIERIISWGDPLGSKCPQGKPESFGFNNDFIAYFPINGKKGDNAGTEALLWVNHEYPNPLFLHGYTQADYDANKKKTAEQIEIERLSVGGSVLHIKKDQEKWKPVLGSKYHRRFTASYPQMAMTGPAAELLPQAVGTLANCSGGRTPWLTALSCEENYPDFNAYAPKEFFYRWNDVPELSIDELRYGWVVEVDPYGELPPKKHSALGRFKHENAAVTQSPAGKIVVYMGDDEVDQHLYKFVSQEALKPNATRAEQSKLLETGTLYAANLQKNQWIPLVWNAANRAVIEKSPIYAEARKKDPSVQIRNQAELLIHTRLAARILGATPLDRCEDCEVHPKDGSIYVAMTNNSKHGNHYGHIVRIVEDGNDAESTKFQYEIFLAGGPQSGLACPDNLAFDPAGNLWVVCDMSSEKINTGAYRPFGNNGLYVVPTEGPSAGEAFQFASGPNDAELTGPWFSDDGTTLFLSVQHPGEMSVSLDKLTSHWPDGGNAIPKPTVVAIHGFKPW